MVLLQRSFRPDGHVANPVLMLKLSLFVQGKESPTYDQVVSYGP